MATKDTISFYHTLLKEVESSNDSSDENKKVMTTFINTLIRSEELVHRGNEYLENGYFIGYLLIESQRIELTIASVLESAERLKASKDKRSLRNINTNKTLGQLINHMENYVSGEDVFTPLEEFRDFRNQITHKLHQDFSKNLNEIEFSIHENYPLKRINDLQGILSIVNVKLGKDYSGYLKDAPIVADALNKLGDKLNEITREIKIKFTVI